MTQEIGNKLVLRFAVQADLPAIEWLLTANELNLDGVREAIDDFVVAEEGGAMVGTVGLEIRGAFALLRSAAVDPARHRGGIGARLVQRVVEFARDRRLQALYLFTPSAAPFFERHGFTRTTREAIPQLLRETGQFSHACGASAVTMVRMLEQ